MAKKESLFNRLFKGSSGCSCGVQIVEDEEKNQVNEDSKEKQKDQK